MGVRGGVDGQKCSRETTNGRYLREAREKVKGVWEMWR